MLRALLGAVLICSSLMAGECLGADLRLAPPAGSYGVVVPVVPLVRLGEDERLVYTVDGSAPTAASWPVTGPILITDTTTLRVAAISTQGVVTRSVSGTYTVSGVLTTTRPVAAPPAGAYPASQLVTLTCSTPGATIRYTLDGSQPTAGSTRYTAPITIATSATLRARAFGGQLSVPIGRFTLRVPAVFPSGVMTASYVITGQQQVATPVIAPASGLYRSELLATATTSTPGAELRYRLDGGDPGPTDALVPAGGIPIDRSVEFSVRGFRSGWTDSAVARTTYTLQVPEPAITPASGLAHVPIAVSIAIPPGSIVRYTTDGSDPVATSDLVSGPIAVDRNLQIRAQAERAGWTSSAVVMAAYVLQPLPPTASLPAGPYVGEHVVLLSDATADATIHYTLDGTLPTSASPVATAPIALPGSCTLTAVASRVGWTDSQALVVSYALQVPTPTLTPAAGPYTVAPTIAATGAGTMRYTLDGTVPTVSSPVLPTDFVLDHSAMVTVVAFRDGWIASAPVSGTYELRVLPPTADVPAGTYGTEQSVTLTAGSPGSTIRATVDGSDPASSPTAQVVTSPLTIDRGLTLRAVAVRDGWTTSPELALNYAFQMPTPTLTPVAGTFIAPIQIQAGAPTGIIHVTTDGTDPTAASPILPAEGLPIDAPASVAVIAVRDGWASSAVVRAAYAFQVATPTWTTPLAPAVGSVTVTAQSASPGVTLRYSLDGSLPTAVSPVLPVTLTRNRLVTVVGFREGWQASAPLAAVWTVTPTVAFAQGSLILPVSAGAVSVPIQLSDATDQAVVVGIQGVDGTARFSRDLTVSPTTVTIPAGATSGEVILQALAGADDRSTVTAELRLSGPTGAALGATAALGIAIPGVAGPPPTFSERRSPLYRLPAERFEAARWSNDIAYRTAYLAAHVPERVWETAAPGSGASGLQMSSTRITALPHTRIVVFIVAAPNVPMTAICAGSQTLMLGGSARALTLATDSDGRCMLEIDTGDPGHAEVIVGSPVCVGNARICLEITP
jgi:hypothetical protein